MERHQPDQQPVGILFTHYGDEWIRGSERCLLDLLTHIDRTQFIPVVWCNSKTLADEVQALGIAVYRSTFPLLLGWQRPSFDIKAFCALVSQGRRLVESHDIKLIHANSGAPNQWLNLVARAAGIPLLAHLHARYPLRDRLTLGLHQVAMAVGVSQPVIDQLLQDGMHPERTCVIPNGIDTERQDRQPAVNLRAMLKLRKRDYLIVTTGSLIHRKGVDLVIDAVFRLIGQGIPARLAVIGDGPEYRQLLHQVQQLGLQRHVHFLRERSDVPGLLRGGVDLFVSGAREEVFGLVLAEASLAGIAVVAPAVGGIPGVVIDGETGYLVPTEDAGALASVMRELYFSPQQRKMMGAAGRRHVLSHFTIQHNVQRFEQRYRQLLHNPAEQMRWHSHWQLRQPASTGVRQLMNLVTGRLSRELTP